MWYFCYFVWKICYLLVVNLAVIFRMFWNQGEILLSCILVRHLKLFILNQELLMSKYGLHYFSKYNLLLRITKRYFNLKMMFCHTKMEKPKTILLNFPESYWQALPPPLFWENIKKVVEGVVFSLSIIPVRFIPAFP